MKGNKVFNNGEEFCLKNGLTMNQIKESPMTMLCKCSWCNANLGGRNR